MSRILALLMSCLLAAGCESLSEIVTSADRPAASVVGASLSGLTLDGADLDLDLEIDNPYGVALPLMNLDYELLSGGNRFVAGKAELDGSVPAGGSRVVTVPVGLRFADVMSALGGVRPGAIVPYEADLALGVDAPGVGRLSLPLSHRGEVPVPAVPGVSVDSFEIEALSLTEARGLLAVRVDNTNQFAANLAAMDYAFSLAGTPVANSSLRKAVSLPAGGSGVLEIPVSFAPSRAGLALLDVLRGNSASYELGGTMQLETPFGPLSLPFERSGTAPLKR